MYIYIYYLPYIHHTPSTIVGNGQTYFCFVPTNSAPPDYF